MEIVQQNLGDGVRYSVNPSLAITYSVTAGKSFNFFSAWFDQLWNVEGRQCYLSQRIAMKIKWDMHIKYISRCLSSISINTSYFYYYSFCFYCLGYMQNVEDFYMIDGGSHRFSRQ